MLAHGTGKFNLMENDPGVQSGPKTYKKILRLDPVTLKGVVILNEVKDLISTVSIWFLAQKFND